MTDLGLQLGDLGRQTEHQLDQLLAAQLGQRVTLYRSISLTKRELIDHSADHGQVSGYKDSYYAHLEQAIR
jgi:hypothetical protein